MNNIEYEQMNVDQNELIEKKMKKISNSLLIKYIIIYAFSIIIIFLSFYLTFKYIQLSNLKSKNTKLKDELTKINLLENDLKQQYNLLDEENKKLNEQSESLEKIVNEYKEKNNNLTNEINKNDVEIHQLNKLITKTEEEINDLNLLNNGTNN